jgi:hypothetical protein
MHLLKKSTHKYRSSTEIMYKIRLFPLVVHVIRKATAVHEIRESKTTTYITLVSSANNKAPAVRVIIKRTNNGTHNFHSVMLHARGTKKSRRSENL